MRAISDRTFAALTIIAEAGGEPYLGKVAVGEVIRRRAKLKFLSDGTIIGTCFAGKQFSVWNDDKQDNALAIRVLQTDDLSLGFQDAMRAWDASETSTLVPDAVNYYRARGPDAILPAWLDEFDLVGSIGKHDFLKRKKP